ncbi:MAG: hypothetical protein K6G75_04240 [Lachnospiraceae bacterium]|nr:hypothetical protein [Lachnospiraceae bacterium]
MRRKIMLGICTVMLLLPVITQGCINKASSNDNTDKITVLTESDIITDVKIDSENQSMDTENESDSIMDKDNVSENQANEQGLSSELTGNESAEEKNDDSETENIDVDLTVLSQIMVYSQVYDMVYYPENYIGKTVKMNGINTIYYDETRNIYYYGCVIMDATACCSQGIEYELPDEFKKPDDYPSEGENICVVGVFDTYMEDSYKYCVLREAKLIYE